MNIQEMIADMDRKKAVDLMIKLQMVFGGLFFFCSLFVITTANAGFNCFLTGLIFMGFAIGSHKVINGYKAPLQMGFLIGVSVMVTLLSLMTAVYWGQLSGCESTTVDLDQYSCSNKSAYGAVCSFAVFLFLIHVPFTICLILWKDDFMEDTASEYTDVGGVGNGGMGGMPQQQQQQQLPHNFSNAPSADL